MSYWNGHSEGQSAAFHVANIVERRMANEMHQNAAEWEQYANGLKAKLEQAEVQTVANTAQWAGEEAVCRQYREALAMLAPDHPLLADQGLVEEVRASAAAKYAQRKGFGYNPTTRGVARKR